LVELVNQTKSAGETLGGVVGVVARGVPPGLGSCARWEERLDGLLAQAVMAVQAVKAMVVGSGLEAAELPGSQVHDPMELHADGIRRTSNHCGGLEGGITTGQDLVVRAFMKPIATVRAGLPSVDMATGQPAQSAYERSDVTAVPACGVIVEAGVAFVLARALLEFFGGGHVDDVLSALATFKRRLGDLGPEGFSPRRR
jgi:chorismate synthase